MFDRHESATSTSLLCVENTLTVLLFCTVVIMVWHAMCRAQCAWGAWGVRTVVGAEGSSVGDDGRAARGGSSGELQRLLNGGGAAARLLAAPALAGLARRLGMSKHTHTGERRRALKCWSWNSRVCSFKPCKNAQNMRTCAHSLD